MSGVDNILQNPITTLVTATQTGGINLIPGLGPAVNQIVENSVQSVENVVAATGQAVGQAVGSISLQGVVNSLGTIVRSVSDIVVKMNPEVIAFNYMKNDAILGHPFNELDKFTGGTITTAVNVSSLPARAARGDAISKQELVKDALFAIEVAAIILSGGSAAVVIGGIVGNWTGNQICSKQTQAQDACKIAFTVVGAAAGATVSDALSDASSSSDLADDSLDDGEDADADTDTNTDTDTDTADSAGDTEDTSVSFTDNLSASAQKTFTSQIDSAATKVAIALCKQNQWVGATECSVLGQIAADYLKQDPDDVDDWIDFLAKEAAKLGVSLLLGNAFPAGSPERNALLAVSGIAPTTSKTPQSVTHNLAVATGATSGGVAAALLILGGAALIAVHAGSS